VVASRRGWPYCQAAHGGSFSQDHRRDRFQAHVPAALHRPLVVLFEQQGTDETCNRMLVGQYPDHIGAPLDPSVEKFDRIDVNPLEGGTAT
jgi:hypothetical protein